MFGVESFTPIINQPDAAILGVNCTEDELVMEDDGTIAKHQVMRISLTFDHRLLDGAASCWSTPWTSCCEERIQWQRKSKCPSWG